MSLRRGFAAGLVAGLALALTEGLLRLVGVGLPSELVADRMLPLLPVQLFIKVIGLLGGPLEAKQKALVGGFAGAALAGAVLGAVYVWLLRRPLPDRHPRLTLGAGLTAAWLGGLLFLGPALQSSYLGLPPTQAGLVTAGGLLLQFVVYAVVLSLALRPPSLDPAEESRRTLLLGGVGLLLALATGGLGSALYRASTLFYDGMSLPGPVDRLTPPDRFYVVTKNLIDPSVVASDWRLEVSGRVARPATYDLDQLLARTDLVDQETTLECISNEVGRGLISNAIWRGVRLRDLLQAAQPAANAVGVSFHAADGYTHTAALATAQAESTLVALAMDGQRLPDHHGYPARLLVPSAYGEVSVKWLTRIDVVDHSEKGYYESQGWEPTFVETTSRIDVPAAGQTLVAGQALRLAGIAYAADRGISAVEVSTDGGATWRSARIESGQPNTWYLWSLDWTPGGRGTRKLMVRARDGRGELQKQTYRPSVPAGVTGVNTIQVSVA